MTLSEARKLAVEAAARDAYVSEALVELVVAPYLSTMADAGWRMARDVGENEYIERSDGSVQSAAWYALGWNACRAAMLEDANG